MAAPVVPKPEGPEIRSNQKFRLGLIPGDAIATAAKLWKLKYFCSNQRNLRIHPAVTVSMHQPYEDTILGEMAQMCVSTARINRLATVFEHPNAYLPERRLNVNDDLFRNIEASSEGRGLVSKTFLTFSPGGHPCLGMNLAYLEMRVAITCLVKHFEFTYNGPVPATSGFIVTLRDKLLVEFRPQVQ